MSDYLGHLAARSLDPARTAVRPRLASRFEPVAPWASPIEMERVEEAPASFETRVEEIAAPPVRASQPVMPPRRRIEPPEPVEPGEPRPPVELVEEERPAPPRRRRARRTVEEKTPEQPSQPAKPVDVRPALPAPVVAGAVPPQSPLARVPLFEPSPPLLPSRGERRNAVRAEVAGLERSQPPKGIKSVPRQEAPAPFLPAHAERGPEREGSQATRPAPPARVVLEPRVTMASPAPPPVFPVPVRTAEAPAPTIQVTIGRIEVRAMPPPAQPSRPRPAAPSALSLEEYLRRRSKGGDG